MDIRDGWSTEYARKTFSVTVNDEDWLTWLHQNVLEPEGDVPTVPLQEIPFKWKSRIMRLLAYTCSSEALRDWAKHEKDAVMTAQAEQELASYENELAMWAKGMKERFSSGAAGAG